MRDRNNEQNLLNTERKLQELQLQLEQGENNKDKDQIIETLKEEKKELEKQVHLLREDHNLMQANLANVQRKRDDLEKQLSILG